MIIIIKSLLIITSKMVMTLEHRSEFPKNEKTCKKVTEFRRWQVLSSDSRRRLSPSRHSRSFFSSFHINFPQILHFFLNFEFGHLVIILVKWWPRFCCTEQEELVRSLERSQAQQSRLWRVYIYNYSYNAILLFFLLHININWLKSIKVLGSC